MTENNSRSQRRRVRVACEPCRERKRRCNGGRPCSTCCNWGYDCYYQMPQKPPRTTTTAVSPFPQQSLPDPRTPTINETVSSDARSYVETVEANSGAAFVRKIGLKIDPSNAPQLSLFGWNVGARQLPSRAGSSISALPIVDIASLDEIKALAHVYFAKVDPCYGFIDSDAFFNNLNARWRSSVIDAAYDGVLAGVAALGSLFSRRSVNITEAHLVELARSILDAYGDGAPTVDIVTAWTLRVVYLRMTARPHPTWIASSTLMHLIEASQLHQETVSETILPATTPCDTDTRRRLVGVAQHLNLWISYDLGLSRVSFSESPHIALSPRPGDFTSELLNLLPTSASLGPENTYKDKDLENLLLQTLSRNHTEPPSVLAQCNLVLCLVRRLRAVNFMMPLTTVGRVLDLFRKSLNAAQANVSNCCPWHHVANVPFHIVSVLLEMDARSALSILPDALRTLKFVADTYPTDSMKEAYSTACILVALYQRRKQEDAGLLGKLLDEFRQVEPDTLLQPKTPTSEELCWLEDLVADIPQLQGADFNQFWQEGLARVSPGNSGI